MSDFSAEQIRAGFALQSMRDTYLYLDRWRARSAQIEEPQSGSELHGDAQIWPGLPPHQVGRVALRSAVQHLNLVRASVEAKELFPIAAPTALRGAQLGAARGVWLLAPDLRHDRQQRGLRTVHGVHRRYLQCLESNPPSVDSAEIATATDQVKRRRDVVRQLWSASSDLTASQAPTATNMVDTAAEVTFQEALHQDSVKGMWRTHSGDAHGLPWPMFPARRRRPRPRDGLLNIPDPMAEYTSGGELWESAESFGACFRLARRGLGTVRPAL